MKIKIKLLGKNLDVIRSAVAACGMCECAPGEEPELIVTHGGDGALLGAEREFPGIPKLPLRDTVTAPTCAIHQAEKIFAAFISGELVMTKLPKLRASTSAGLLYGINDLVVNTAEPTSALRYRVSIDGELHAQEVVGDGVCFSSIHGSTAYYRSITRGIFKVGVGLAFSNSTEVVDHLVLPENSVVTVEILRGEALVMADNDPCKLRLAVGDKVILQQTAETAAIFGLDGFMCPECRYLRHHLLSANEKRH
ncbi:MAG: hypothetical protein E7057_06550 [Lentisphaerae bacterium]|nr:hypothetical protein [Lentisphaerota bacterium]